MTEVLDSPAESIDNVVANFIDKQRLRQLAEKLLAAATARLMLIRMDAGEPYDIESFIFVVSLGEPERLKMQADMLRSAAGLEAGSIVGVSNDRTIGCIGIVAENPLVMDANVGSPSNPESEQSNRNLEARLVFKDLVRYNEIRSEKKGYQPVYVFNSGIKGSPYMVNLISSDAEPHPDDPEVKAVECNQLLNGADEIMKFVTANNDTIGLKQFTELSTRLARGYLGAIVVTDEYSHASIN